VTADPQCATAPKKGSTGVVTLAKCVTPASPAQQWKYDSSSEQLTTAQDGAWENGCFFLSPFPSLHLPRAFLGDSSCFGV
jgi:hypothetical protein